MKFISFYLPQFHPIPENDAWWGKGFTEWTNVAKAKPLFKGHHQPHIPADLGFYDLRLEETRIAQAELAKEHGISSFCYYHYWFNGKMLLERPFNEVLASGKPDFPFCLCWANENWTRRWDGMDQEILMTQDYDNYNPEQHIEWLNNAFLDKRYIKINGKPLFLIYHADKIRNIENVISIWRKSTINKGFQDIYLCAVKGNQFGFRDEESFNLGFDAIVEFQPNPGLCNAPLPENFLSSLFKSKMNKLIEILRLRKIISERPFYSRFDYSKYVDFLIKRPISPYKIFPCAFPSWDNTARRRAGAWIFQNDNSEAYARLLENSIDRVKKFPREEQIIFINAWNEWAEGCHLEPDIKNAGSFLLVTKNIASKYFSKYGP